MIWRRPGHDATSREDRRQRPALRGAGRIDALESALAGRDEARERLSQVETIRARLDASLGEARARIVALTDEVERLGAEATQEEAARAWSTIARGPAGVENFRDLLCDFVASRKEKP